MDEKVYYWGSVLVAAAALALLILNIALIGGNRTLQNEVQQRQAIISNGTALVQVHQGLIQALAEASVAKDDKDIRDLLAAQGITVKQNANNNGGDAGAGDDAAAPAKSKKK